MQRPRRPPLAVVPRVPTSDPEDLRRAVHDIIEVLKLLVRDRRQPDARVAYLTIDELLRLGVVTRQQLTDLGLDI